MSLGDKLVQVTESVHRFGRYNINSTRQEGRVLVEKILAFAIVEWREIFLYDERRSGQKMCNVAKKWTLRICIFSIFAIPISMSANLSRRKHPSFQQQKCIEMKANGNIEIDSWNNFDCDFWSSIDGDGRLISGYKYRYLSYAGLLQRMRALEYIYPDLVSLESAQDKFDLPVAGRWNSLMPCIHVASRIECERLCRQRCREDDQGLEESGCRVWILQLGWRNATSPEVPQVCTLLQNSKLAVLVIIMAAEPAASQHIPRRVNNTPLS
jgi:hypothetical protein